jgi:type IV secretory pathway VirB4 component
LNARQIDLIANAVPKRDYYLASREGARLFELGLGPATLAFVAASRPEDQTLMDRIASETPREAFAAAWLEARGVPAAAEALRRFERASAPAPEQALEIDYALMEASK